MKKTIVLLLAVILCMSLLPMSSMSVLAVDVEGDWTTYRHAGDYGKPDSYKPAPGYEYTGEGFHMISADYSDTYPFGTIQSKETVSIKDGVYMELRVDDYAYGGVDDLHDHWISFHIWDSQGIAPGNMLDYGQGWLSLCRRSWTRPGITAQSINSSSSGQGSFQNLGITAVTPRTDLNGKQIYTFEIKYEKGNYIISLCGVPVAGSEEITKHLNQINSTGEFYIGVTLYSSVAGSNIEATMLKFGTSAYDATTPVGFDFKEPEVNVLKIADIADPDTIPVNQPCLLYDANKTSWSGEINAQHVTLTPQDNGAFKIQPTIAGGAGFHQWSISNRYSFDASDFPVISILVEDPYLIFDSGYLRYFAGDNVYPDGVHLVQYSLYDENCLYFGDDEEYYLMFVDLKDLLSQEDFEEGWNGRINGLRFDYSYFYVNDPIDPEVDFFFFHYAGIFRSIEEAQVYGENYLTDLGVIKEEGPLVPPPVVETMPPEAETMPPEAETMPPEVETMPPVEIPTEAPTEAPMEAPTEPEAETVVEPATDAVTKEDTTDTPETDTEGKVTEVETQKPTVKPSYDEETEKDDDKDDDDDKYIRCNLVSVSMPVSLLAASGLMAMLLKKKKED